MFEHSLISFIENGTAVHVFTIRLRHGPGTRLGAKETLISMLFELHQEKIVVLLSFHFLPQKHTNLSIFNPCDIPEASQYNKTIIN